MASVQMRVLERVSGTDLYTQRWILCNILGANRSAIIDEGAETRAGGTVFDVPAGTVRFGEFVSVRGQYFRVDGVEPVAPFFTRERLETVQVGGTFEIVDAFDLTCDGFTLRCDGFKLVA